MQKVHKTSKLKPASSNTVLYFLQQQKHVLLTCCSTQYIHPSLSSCSTSISLSMLVTGIILSFDLSSGSMPIPNMLPGVATRINGSCKKLYCNNCVRKHLRRSIPFLEVENSLKLFLHLVQQNAASKVKLGHTCPSVQVCASVKVQPTGQAQL